MSRNVAALGTAVVSVLLLGACASESAEQESSEQGEAVAGFELKAPEHPVGPRELESYFPAEDEWPDGFEPDDVSSGEETAEFSFFFQDPEEFEERVEGWMEAAEEQRSADAEGAQECLVALERWKEDQLNTIETAEERHGDHIEYAQAEAFPETDDAGPEFVVLLRSGENLWTSDPELFINQQVACLPLGVLDRGAAEEVGELELEGGSGFWQITGGDDSRAEVSLVAVPGDAHHVISIEVWSDDPDDVDDLVQGVEEIYWHIQEGFSEAAD